MLLPITFKTFYQYKSNSKMFSNTNEYLFSLRLIEKGRQIDRVEIGKKIVKFCNHLPLLLL